MMDFTAPGLEHRPAIEGLRAQYRHRLSSHAFASIFIWRKSMGLDIYAAENVFCVRSLTKGEESYFFPCGGESEKRELIRALLDTGRPVFKYVRKEDAELLNTFFAGRFRLGDAREDWEYIYDRAAQTALAGGEYRSLRAKVNHGRGLSDWRVEELSPGNIGAALQITEQWAAKRPAQAGHADIDATAEACRCFMEMGMRGIVLFGNGTPQGFAMGSELSSDTFDLHISKTLMDGMDCYLKWELYSRLPERIVYINREEDLGLKGLRQHKTEMRPSSFNTLWKAEAIQ